VVRLPIYGGCGFQGVRGWAWRMGGEGGGRWETVNKSPRKRIRFLPSFGVTSPK
jgi:hypothetical protein